jgi:beta-lactam-binding protein with PASTA domain
MRRFLKGLVMVLVLLAVALTSALTAMRYAIHGREVAVPKLIGMTPAEAQRTVEADGLQLDIESRYYSAEVPEGRIMSQVPDAATQVRRGWRVRAAQSLGPLHVTVPSLIGESVRAAEINVRRRGLELGSVAVAQLPGAQPDVVVAQSPEPEASGITSPKINVLVSSPAEEGAPAYIMPDFLGRPLDDVARSVAAAGLKFGKVTSSGPSSPPGSANGAAHPAIVVKQVPAPGQQVYAGAMVNFEVAR